MSPRTLQQTPKSARFAVAGHGVPEGTRLPGLQQNRFISFHCTPAPPVQRMSANQYDVSKRDEALLLLGL